MRISFDFDDVIFGFIRHYAAWRSATGRPSFDPEHQQDYDFASTIGITRAENEADMAAFVNDPSTLAIPPLSGCVPTLRALSAQGLDLVVVTARVEAMAAGTEAYLARWLPAVSELVCTGSPPEEHRRTKADWCARLRAAAHVDDNPKHLDHFAGTDCTPVLFGTYPWSTPERFAHAVDWGAVPAVLSRCTPVRRERRSR